MPAVFEPILRIEPVPGKPGSRRVIVSYVLVIDETDLASGSSTVERAVVRGQDLHDSPTRPQPLAIVIDRTESIDRPGRLQRELACDVKRIDLDVQQDWWRTGNGGEIEAIAEMPDHLIAEIEVAVGTSAPAKATTPIVSGSWGPLGQS